MNLFVRGVKHFIMNNFKNFQARYENRITNFRNYMQSGNEITFILVRYNKDIEELNNVIQSVYPNLKFSIYNKTPSNEKIFIRKHFQLLGLNEHEIEEELLTD